MKLKGRGLFGSFADAYISIRRTLYGLFLRAPGVRSQVQKQVSEAITKLQGKLVPTGPDVVRYLTLPKEGWSEETVMKELETLANMDHTRWEDGFVSGAVYHGGDSLMKLQTEAFGKFTVANPIHPDVFPGVRKMEAEIVAMVLSMFNAPPGAAGVTTSGGTESILMACLSARQKAYAERGVKEPEMSVDLWIRSLYFYTNQYLGFYQKQHTQHSAKQVNISVSKFISSLVPLHLTKYIFQAYLALLTAIPFFLLAPHPTSLMDSLTISPVSPSSPSNVEFHFMSIAVLDHSSFPSSRRPDSKPNSLISVLRVLLVLVAIPTNTALHLKVTRLFFTAPQP